MAKILIIFAHPAFQKSRVNKILLKDVQQIAGVTFHDLYQAYPDFDIDVKHEQQLLIQHDIIIFHHPFFWYSTPAILKEWQDLVLEHGWAYGRAGKALAGKIFFNVISTGGPQMAYQPDGFHKYTIKQLIAPLERTVILCKMKFLPPFVVHGTHAITPEESAAYRKNYHALLEQFRDEQIDIDALARLEYLNDYFPTHASPTAA